jgi:hypothetical protein
MHFERPTIAYELIEPQAVVVIYEGALCSDTEWDAHVEFLRSILHYGNRLRFLVYNEHGQMPRDRQLQVKAVMHGLSHKVAMVSPSPVARFVVSVFLLGNRKVSIFSPGQLKDAYAHLGCDESTRAAINDSLTRLRSCVWGNVPVARLAER